MEKPLTIAFILAHPDDEHVPFGLPAELTLQGHDVHLVSVTDGSLGSHSMRSRRKIAAQRQREFHEASNEIQATEHILGIRDGAVNPMSHRQRRKLLRLLRETQPDIAIIPSSKDYHDDHVKTHELALWALFHLPDAPIVTRRLFKRIQPTHKDIALFEADTQGSQTWENTKQDNGQDMELNTVNTIIPLSPEAIMRSRISFKKHASQLQGKDYVALAVKGAQRRGRQIGAEFAVGLNFRNFGGYAFSTKNLLEAATFDKPPACL